MLSIHRNFILSVFLILFGFVVQTGLYAGGQKEDRLPDAQKLIEEGKYNDAIMILSEIMKTNPDQFTEAEKLMREIRIARDEYNKLYAELITVLNPPRGEDIDEDKAYGLIRSMEALDKTPNKAAVAAFAQARDTIVFAVTNRTFENIMDECTVLLAEKKYLEGIDKYLSGFILHREFFDKKGYGNIITNQIDNDIAGIKSFVNQFKSLYELINTQAQIINTAVQAESLEDLENSIQGYRDLLLEALILKRRIVNMALSLDSIRISIQKESESDIPYLSTLRVLSKGRIKSKTPEGIAGAIELYWDNTISASINNIEPLLTESYKKSLALYNTGNFPDNERELFITRRYTNVLLTVLNLWGGMIDLDVKGDPTEKGWSLIKKWLPHILYMEELDKDVPQFIKLSEQNRAVQRLISDVDTSDDPSKIEARRKDLLGVRNDIREDEKKTEQWIDKIRKITASGIDTKLSASIVNDLSKYQKDFYNESFVIETGFAEKIARLRIDPLEKIVQDEKNQIENANSMITGAAETIDNVQYLVKRPDRAALILKSAENTLKNMDSALSDIRAVIRTYNKEVRDSESVQIQALRTETLQSKIKQYLSELAVAAGKARALNDEADNLYNLGSLRLDEAYARYDRENYDGARSKYFEAETAFLKSLEYREDEKLRKLLSGEMAKFYERLMVALNKQIIREVRTLINRGKDYYNVEKFIKAEQSFQQAKERYKVTHEDPNPEVEGWLVKVKKALEATSGRVIVQTDPLYPEMIHILNLAEEDFNKGKKLLEENQKDLAKVLFDEAVKNIEYVKETFPRNFKASVLYLRILEFTEKDTFAVYFKSMYESAVAKIKTDPKSADDDLLALYEVNPEYPGIKRSLYKSGVAAGRIIPPPAKVDLAKARSLYTKAKKIADADNRAQFPIAIAYLEEAVQIDSNYNAAAVLLDQLRTSTGGISASAMSKADMQKLRYAENLYIEGKYLEASIIINQLWNNPANRKSAKLNDLKKKVDSRL